MIKKCVLPILLYRRDNWCLTKRCINILESFVDGMCKRLLKPLKWYFNTSVMIVIGYSQLNSHTHLWENELFYTRLLTTHKITIDITNDN